MIDVWKGVAIGATSVCLWLSNWGNPLGLSTATQGKTSGIHGGYRLVSIYDLPDWKLTGGEVFRSKLWSSQI